MKFEGQIKKTPCIDYFAYHRSIRENRNKLMLRSDFEVEGCYNVHAVIYGNFDDSFICDGVDPFAITETGKEKVQADIQISKALVGKLESDGETSPENIAIIKSELNES